MIKTHRELRQVLRQTEPNLERVLALGERTRDIPASLQLRHTQCGLASAALQKYLRHRYGLETTRLIHVSNNPALFDVEKPQTHVLLRTNPETNLDLVIDPTYSQFMNYLGLTTESARDNQLEALYPQSKIATFPTENIDRFTTAFSNHLSTTWEGHGHEIPQPPEHNRRHQVLRGVGHEAIQGTITHLWDISRYRPLNQDETSPGLEAAATQIAKSLAWLDHNPSA